MKDKPKRTHARRTCVTCKARKARCELPDIQVQSRPGKPLALDKACHRCRTLSLDCYVDAVHSFLPVTAPSSRSGAAASPSNKYPSASPHDGGGGEISNRSSTTTSPSSSSNAVAAGSLFNMFSVTPQSSSSVGTSAATPSTHANEAGGGGLAAAGPSAPSPRDLAEVERQIFSRCLDLIAKPLSHLERLVNASIHTQTDPTHSISATARVTAIRQGPGALHKVLFTVVDDETASVLLPSLLSLLLFAPYLPHPEVLRRQCRQGPTVPSLFLLATMYLIALRQAASPSGHGRMAQLASIVEQARERILLDAPAHTYAIMGLDLCTTYDSLSEITKLVAKGVDNSDSEQVPFRLTRGEATMNRALCWQLMQQQQQRYSQDRISTDSTLDTLYASVKLNAMHVLEDSFHDDTAVSGGSSSSSNSLATSPDGFTPLGAYNEVSFHNNYGKSPGLVVDSVHRTRAFGVATLGSRLDIRASVLQAKMAANRACRNRMEGSTDDDGFARELDLLVSTAERQLAAARAKWEREAPSSTDEADLVNQYLQLETCGARFDILSMVYRALVWPSLDRRVDVFPSGWLDDPLVGSAAEMTWHRLCQVEVSHQIVHLMKHGGDGPLRVLGRQYASSRQDAAEESMAIFLSLSSEENVRRTPLPNVCATLAYSVKLLMETQAAAMEHFDHVMPREKTWKVMMRQVGETLTEMGKQDPMRGLLSATGTIITRMHLAVENWKDIYKEKKQQQQQQQQQKPPQGHHPIHQDTGRANAVDPLPGNDWLNSDSQSLLDAFWAHDPLDEFFSALFGSSGDEFAAFVPSLAGVESTL